MGADPAQVDPIGWSEALTKARFCLAYGIQPSEYDGLDNTEVAAFHEAARELTERTRP